MGLDSVELVMAFEERFGIEIKDEEAEKLRTPNLVIEFVAKKLNAVSSDYCDTQRAFYRLRRGAIETLKIPRKQLSPQSRLEDMFALGVRQQQWSEFGSFVGALSWPRLQFPTGLSGFVLLTSALISFVSFFLMAGQISVWIKIPLMTILWGLLVSIGFKLANPLRNRFPERMETVADLCRSLVFYCPDNLDQDGRTHNRENIRLLVREIICEQLGVENDFDDNADFIDDLGVD